MVDPRSPRDHVPECLRLMLAAAGWMGAIIGQRFVTFGTLLGMGLLDLWRDTALAIQYCDWPDQKVE